MSKRKQHRETEVEMLEGEVTGHFYKFVEGKVRPFYDGSEKGGAELHMPPKLMCGVLVEVSDGQDRIPINVRRCEEPLPTNTQRSKVTKKARQAVLKAVEKAYPACTSVTVRKTTYLDNKWKKFELVEAD